MSHGAIPGVPMARWVPGKVMTGLGYCNDIFQHKSQGCCGCVTLCEAAGQLSHGMGQNYSCFGLGNESVEVDLPYIDPRVCHNDDVCVTFELQVPPMRNA
jgi:hypothetical protein